ncbi:MAG: putative addiction module antidote protein [Chromatiaceae bacterium]|nr:putative addiction module antidote protein [Chromatiaceae bacterium]
MAEHFSRWDSADYLGTSEEMQLYLDACIAEDTGDGRLIAQALGTLARARNMAQLARETGISREGLYKALSGHGQPNFSTIVKVARGLGLEVAFKPRPV